MPIRSSTLFRPKVATLAQVASPRVFSWGSTPVNPTTGGKGGKKKKQPVEVATGGYGWPHNPYPNPGGGGGGGNKGGGNKGGGKKDGGKNGGGKNGGNNGGGQNSGNNGGGRNGGGQTDDDISQDNWYEQAEAGKGNFGEVVPPALDPIEALRNSEAHRAMYTGYRDQIGLLMQQQAIANRRKAEDLFRNQQARFGELQSFAGASNERGTLGSSMDFTGRMGIRDEFLANAQALRNAHGEGKLANIAQRMQARREYEAGVLQLKMNKAAQQSLDEIYDSIESDAGGSGGGGNGKNGKNKKDKNKKGDNKKKKNKQSYAELAAELKRKQDQGYKGKKFLEAHPKFAKRRKKKQDTAKGNVADERKKGGRSNGGGGGRPVRA